MVVFHLGFALDGNSSCACEFDRIPGKIEQNATETAGVAPHARREARRYICGEKQPFVLGARFENLERIS
jgi:hypothetical protein